MKKLMTILVVFALCGVAMAQNGSSSAKKQIPLNDGLHDYVTYVNQYQQGSSALDYVASSSKTPWGEDEGHKVAHVYFKTFSQKGVAVFELLVLLSEIVGKGLDLLFPSVTLIVILLIKLA